MKVLRTEYAALLGIILILLATVKHAFEVYTEVMYINSEPTLWQNIYIAIMLVAIDFAVVLFTIHGNSYAAKTFASMIFLVNLFAFWQEIPWTGWEEMAITSYIPGFLFSCMFAYGLYYFTDLFSELLHRQNRLGELMEEVKEAQEKVGELEADIAKKVFSIEAISLKKEEIQQQLVVAQEAQEKNQILMEKAEKFDLLIRYIMENEGYLDKSVEALRKGVDYWHKKDMEAPLELKDRVKLLAYEGAYMSKNSF